MQISDLYGNRATKETTSPQTHTAVNNIPEKKAVQVVKNRLQPQGDLKCRKSNEVKHK